MNAEIIRNGDVTMTEAELTKVATSMMIIWEFLETCAKASDNTDYFSVWVDGGEGCYHYPSREFNKDGSWNDISTFISEIYSNYFHLRP